MFARLPRYVAICVLSGLFVGDAAIHVGRAEPQEKAKEKPAPTAKPKTDHERLQGTWRVVSVELGGEKWDATTSPTYTFRGDRIIVDWPKRLNEGTFELNTKKDPKWID